MWCRRLETRAKGTPTAHPPTPPRAAVGGTKGAVGAARLVYELRRSRNARSRTYERPAGLKAMATTETRTAESADFLLAVGLIALMCGHASASCAYCIMLLSQPASIVLWMRLLIYVGAHMVCLWVMWNSIWKLATSTNRTDRIWGILGGMIGTAVGGCAGAAFVSIGPGSGPIGVAERVAVPAFSAILWTSLLLAFRERREPQSTETLCTNCGYNLSGIVFDQHACVCPECGTVNTDWEQFYRAQLRD